MTPRVLLARVALVGVLGDADFFLNTSRMTQANLRILEIDEVKTVPYGPLSHPFIERLIGSVRREFLDHVVFWNSLDLERKLTSTFDNPNVLVPTAHSFDPERIPWFDIADNLPRYEGFSGNSPLLRHGPVSDGLPAD